MIRRHALAFVLALAVAGCASAPGGAGTQVTLDLEVTNNLIPPGPAYVYMLTPGGIERDLGTVFGGTHTLRYRGLALNGDYQFVAKTGDRAVASPVLNLKNVLSLRWDLERNYIEVTNMVQ